MFSDLIFLIVVNAGDAQNFKFDPCLICDFLGTVQSSLDLTPPHRGRGHHEKIVKNRGKSDFLERQFLDS
jgi:hypothetical protein